MLDGKATLLGKVISVSGLPTTQLLPSARVSYQVDLLESFISAPFAQDSGDSGKAKWIASTRTMKKHFLSERIVFRECYDHLVPIMEAKLEQEEGNVVGVGGTPGIGKTVFGFFLLRRFLAVKKRSTVYWDGKQATLFTKEPKYMELFGLKQTCDLLGEKWQWGAWPPTSEHLEEFLLFEDIYVIHDPAPGFIVGGSQTSSNKLVIILSFGHALMSHWATKRDGAPAFLAAMPFFDYDEIVINKDNLFHGTGMSITDDNLAEKYKKFGGSIRHWMKSTEDASFRQYRPRFCGF